MLKIMNTIERISPLIPKFKLQLIFLEEREKLFQNMGDGLPTNTSTISKTSHSTSTDSFVNSTSLNSISSEKANQSSTISDSPRVEPVVEVDRNVSFPDFYQIPPLTIAVTNQIEAGSLQAFGPHCQGRQVLIDTVVHDLITNFNLFYPTKTQYKNIGSAIVKHLKLPLSEENISIWKDALQTKLKRIRGEYPENLLVQQTRCKYSRLGSGRPVKKRIDETAVRDRHKQLIIIPYNHVSNDIQLKLEQLQDLSQIDTDTQLHLWTETFHFRRQIVREQSTVDILKMFPAYNSSFLIFEEIKMLANIDLTSEVRKQVPVLLDKLVDTASFITDSPPIRLIKVLCRLFDETVQHVLCTDEPTTPYPTLVLTNDFIDVYVDFVKVISINSPDDALGLLIGMYTIFELSFDKKSRTTRFLYSVFHGDKQYLSNSIRVFIKEKNIEIRKDCSKLSSISLTSSSNNPTNSTTLTTTTTTTTAIVEETSPVVEQTITFKSSTDNSQSNPDPDMVVDTVEYNNNSKTSSSSSCTAVPQLNKKRKQKQTMNIIDDNDESLIPISENNHNHSSALKDVTNSASGLRRTKRKRRC